MLQQSLIIYMLLLLAFPVVWLFRRTLHEILLIDEA